MSVPLLAMTAIQLAIYTKIIRLPAMSVPSLARTANSEQEIPQIPFHTLLSEGRLLSWYGIWISNFRPATMLCGSSAAIWIKIKDDGRVHPIFDH